MVNKASCVTMKRQTSREQSRIFGHLAMSCLEEVKLNIKLLQLINHHELS